MRVLEIIDSLYAGGAESLLKNFLIRAKKYESFSIDVCTLYSKNIFKEELEKNGIKLYELNLKFKYDLRGVLKIVRLIKEIQYDIVHVHLFPADIFVAIATLFSHQNIKFIFSEHNIYNRRRSILLYKPIDKFVYSRYEKIVCVSNQVKEELNKYIKSTKDKSIVIKNAIPVDENLDDLPKKYDVLFVGRFEDAKGVDVLIKAISILKEKYHENIKVAILGDGSKKDYLTNLVSMLSIEDRIEFLGIRKDVKYFMQSSKIFVLPSRWEGLPMVILEAMANKIPIITTPVGGIKEVIQNGINGILVKPEDPEELASKIHLLLNNETLRENLSQNAFVKVKSEYSISAYTKSMLQFYEKLLNQKEINL